MFTDKIQDYLAPLRTHNVRRPFESVESLLAQSPVRESRIVSAPVWQVLTVCSVLALLAAGVWYGLNNRDVSKFGNASLQRTAHAKDAIGHTPTKERLSPISTGQHFISPSAAASFVTTRPTAMRPEPIFVISQAEDLFTSAEALLPNKVLTTTFPVLPSVSNPSVGSERAMLPFPSGVNPIPDSDIASMYRFGAFLQGGIGQQLSSDPLYRYMDLSSFSIVFRYSVSSSSSFGISAGKEVYVSTLVGYSISYHDIISTHGGVTIHNIIGEVDPANTTTYWLGWSYRFTLGETTSLVRPYAEILGGAADLGGITHESIGVELFGASQFHLELSAEARQLFAGGGLVLQKAGVTMGVGYLW